MIFLDTNCPFLRNELGEILRLFYTDPIVYTDQNGVTMRVTHRRGVGSHARHYASINKSMGVADEISFSCDPLIEKRFQKYAAKQAVYRALVAETGRIMPWGSLTGVRPVKMLSQLRAMHLQPEIILQEEFDVSQERIDLIQQIEQNQSRLPLQEKDICVYIGIPFCVSRCTYCSFPGVVNPKLHERYFAALEKEMESAANALKKYNKSVKALYIGGGTPSSFCNSLFEKLVFSASKYFPSNEYTVEAGRPDTITANKLAAAKAAGVTRICINPQTMNDTTLQAIGRTHGSEAIIQAFELARKMGFEDINADLIAGLSGETLENFQLTISRMLDIKPESITIHTLALKRGSKLTVEGYQHALSNTVSHMVDYGRHQLLNSGYQPYYLYRQKYMAENLENVGYCLPFSECMYNIAMMDDACCVLALGAGSISKIVGGGKILRDANPKDVLLYLQRIERACEKYDALIKLTEELHLDIM